MATFNTTQMAPIAAGAYAGQGVGGSVPVSVTLDNVANTLALTVNSQAVTAVARNASNPSFVDLTTGAGVLTVDAATFYNVVSFVVNAAQMAPWAKGTLDGPRAWGAAYAGLGLSGLASFLSNLPSRF